MRILFVHPNFPAQFGHLARRLANEMGHQCWFISETPAGKVGNLERIQYQLKGGATERSHFCSRTFENAVWHCDGVYAALRGRDDVRPDLIVGHSGFGSTLFLRELYPDTPVINLFEYFYSPYAHDNDMNFRTDLGWEVGPEKRQRAMCRNAMILLDLQNCDGAYTPTEFQRGRFPAEYQSKLQVIFDGVDRTIFHGYDQRLRPTMGQRGDRVIGGVRISAKTRVVTYVSRGFESMRGFDLFIRMTRRVLEQFPDVHFFVVGADRVAYGGDLAYIAPYQSFAQWTLAHYPVNPDRVSFMGRLAPVELGKLLAMTDLHCYWTAPFVLSWSMMNAMSCGAVVLGSDTGPVREMIADGETGLLANFFDVEQWAARAVEVLRDPDAFAAIGQSAETMIQQRYSLEAVLPRMVRLFESTTRGH